MKYNEIIEQFFPIIDLIQDEKDFFHMEDKHNGKLDVCWSSNVIDVIPKQIKSLIGMGNLLFIPAVRSKFKTDILLYEKSKSRFFLTKNNITKIINEITDKEKYGDYKSAEFPDIANSVKDFFQFYKGGFDIRKPTLSGIDNYYLFGTLLLMLLNQIITLYNQKNYEIDSELLQYIMDMNYCCDTLLEITNIKEQKEYIEKECGGNVPQGEERIKMLVDLLDRKIEKLQASDKYEPRQNIMEWNEFIRNNAPAFKKDSFRKWIHQAPMNGMNKMKVLRRIKGTTWIDIDIFWKWFNKEADRNREVISNWDF